MRNRRIFLPVLMLVLAGLACNLPGASVTQPTQNGPAPTATPANKPGEPTATSKAEEVPTVQPTVEPTATKEPPAVATATKEYITPNVVTFEYKGFTLEYPDGFFDKVTGKIAPVELNDPQGTGWTGPIPETYQIDFTGLPITNPSHPAQMLVFPIKEFQAVNAPAGDIAQKLDAILRANQLADKNLPFLPMWNAGQVFSGGGEILAFANGRGIRYLSCYAQALVPIDSSCVFYTFQGLSADGKYYLSVIFPIKLPVLDSAENKARFDAALSDGTKYAAYVKDMTALIASAKAEDFTPNLATLDKVVQSAVVAPTVALKSPDIPAIDCPGAMSTRLVKEQLIRVTFTDGTPLRLRQAASKTAKTLETIAEGGTMKIQGGPQCTDKGIWWQVKLTKSGNVGWVLEGENGVYYLEPAP